MSKCEPVAIRPVQWLAGVIAVWVLVAIRPALGDDVVAEPVRPAAAAEPMPVRIFLSEADNLQWLNFWIAQGAGLLADEGLDVTLVFPPRTGGGAQLLLQGKADVALMSRPAYLNAIGKGQPVVVFANLFRNDPINLVVQGDMAQKMQLSDQGPLAERLDRLRGLRVGVAHGPPTRLRALLESVGMDPERDIEMVIIPGREQNAAFGERRVDALYAHTPYLETALVEQGAVLVVNQSAGEVPVLAGRQIHALVTTQDHARTHPEVLIRLARAMFRAQQLVHSDVQAAVEAVRASQVELEAPEGLSTIVAIYAPAVPDTPDVSAELAFRELALFPEHKIAPDLSLEAIAGHVDNQYVEAALAGEH